MLGPIRGLLLVLAMLSLAPAPKLAPEDAAEHLVRAGNEAISRGDFLAALARFEEAELLTDDPGAVAFGQGVAHFRLALLGGEGTPAHLVEAAARFRCNLAPDDPRRPRALLGLASTLLLRATRYRDHSVCAEALRALDQCRTLETADAARRLLARARLVEWQLLPVVKNETDKPPEPEKGPEQPPEKSVGPKTSEKEKDPNGTNGPGTRPTPVNEPGNKAEPKKDGPQGTQAAEGTQSAVKDRDPLPPALSPDEALAQVRAANKKILAEQKGFRRSLVRPPAEGVPDW